MKAKYNTDNLWNRLVVVKDSHVDKDKRDMAEMLLNQMTTAAGQTMLKNEVANFLFRAE